MDLSFSRLSPPAVAPVPFADASAVLAALSAYRCAMPATQRAMFAPADGAFNGAVARLLTAWQR